MITLDCGCKFEEGLNGPVMPLDVNTLNLDCQATWDLISCGRTIGCFQIDSGLGRTMSKQLKPQNMDHLAALIAIMRPSCLQGVLEDGKSIAHHFIDRKNGIEEAVCPYYGLESILKNTYYLLIYQEQSIKLGQDIAGMSLSDADYYIRKGIGKKKANIISEGEKIFIDGCKKLGKVSDKDALAIWDWIKSSARYQFNASHSYGYALMSYHTAYGKAHFPLKFYRSWLNHAYDKIKPLDELRNLVLDAKAFNVDILNPDLRLKNNQFVEKDGRLYFGLEYIKEVGESAVRSLTTLVDALDLNTLSWPSLLFKTLLRVNRTAIKRLIATGALDYYKDSREKLLFEHDVALKFTDKEVDWIIKNLDLQQYSSIEPILTEILALDTGKGKPISNKNRKNIIKGLHYSVINPAYSLINNIGRNVALERSFLGVELSAHKHDLIEENISDCTIKEFNDGAKFEMMKFLVEIDEVKTILTKKKKEEMSFVSASDATGQINDIIIFPEAYRNYSHFLVEGNSVIIIGKRGERDNLIVNSIKEVE